MNRLTTEQLEFLDAAIKQGKSLNCITKEMKVSKTTIYHHFRKKKGRTYRPPVISFSSEEQLGEVVGLFAGDGTQYFESNKYKYGTHFCFGTKRTAFVMYVKELVEGVFGKKFYIVTDKQKRQRVSTISKEVYLFFHTILEYDVHDKSHTVRVKEKYHTKEFAIGFLRGFLDTDGTVSRTNTGLRVAYFTTSKDLAYQLSHFLSLWNIRNSVYYRPAPKSIYQIFVSRKDSEKVVELLKPHRAGIRDLDIHI